MPDDKQVVMVLRDKFVDMMVKANQKYQDYIKIVKGRKVLYLQVLHAINGCIKSVMLWYNLVNFDKNGLYHKSI